MLTRACLPGRAWCGAQGLTWACCPPALVPSLLPSALLTLTSTHFLGLQALHALILSPGVPRHADELTRAAALLRSNLQRPLPSRRTGQPGGPGYPRPRPGTLLQNGDCWSTTALSSVNGPPEAESGPAHGRCLPTLRAEPKPCSKRPRPCAPAAAGRTAPS